MQLVELRQNLVLAYIRYSSSHSYEPLHEHVATYQNKIHRLGRRFISTLEQDISMLQSLKPFDHHQNHTVILGALICTYTLQKQSSFKWRSAVWQSAFRPHRHTAGHSLQQAA